MADMTTIKGRIAETIYPNGQGAITAELHQALLLEMVDNINKVKQDVLVSGQNIRPLISGESLLGGDALAVLGTAFIYEYESEQVFAMMNGTREEVKPWVLNRATASQVAQSISILRQNVLQAIVPVVIKTRAESAIICWEYDGLIYEIEWENDAYKVVTTPKGNEFDKQGNYPLLHAGTADDLAGRGESVPASFGFRASGGKSIKDGRAYIKRIKGNSVVCNQLYKPRKEVLGTQVKNGVTFIVSEDGIVQAEGTADGASAVCELCVYADFKSSHKYILIAIGAPEGKWSRQGLYFSGNNLGSINSYTMIESEGYKIFQPQGEGKRATLTLTAWAGKSLSCKFRPMFVDLTKAFPNDWQNINTIEDFNARVATLGVDMNAYNEGQVIHCNTESIKSVGDNAWDEEWEQGYFDSETGEPLASVTIIRSKNFIPVLPNEEYYYGCYTPVSGNSFVIYFYDKNKQFISSTTKLNAKAKTPSNAAYMKFRLTTAYGNTYKNDIMITLVHSGWKQDTDAGYQPYWQDTLPLPIIRKYFPDGMKKAGSAHDEIRYNKASGKWEMVQRMGEETEEDFKVSFISTQQDGGNIFSVKVSNLKVPTNDKERMSGLLCNRYQQPIVNPNLAQMSDKSMIRFNDGNIYIKDSSYTDASEFKKNLTIVYELAEPIVTELDAEDQNFRDYYNVADFGTEMSQSSVPSAPFSADIIYQFNAVDMIREHELEITELQSIIAEQQSVIATMQAQLTSLINGGQ